MTETFTAVLAGRAIQVTRPTDGQYEALARIYHTLQRGTDDHKAEFWTKQIDRLGRLLDNLIAEGDREAVEDLFLAGKVDTGELLRTIFETFRDADSAGKANDTVKAVKANSARVRRK